MTRRIARPRWLLVAVLASLAAGQCPAEPRAEPTSDFAYATMSDGVKIALAVSYPRGFDPDRNEAAWPALLTMSGYRGEVGPFDPGITGHHYVVVRVSQRGTGASGGAFSLFEPRIARDGFEIIENWIVRQPWSNGRVGVFGHSWSGLNAIQIAATNPPSLAAVMASAVFDDAYRGIARPGGILNSGFPFQWLTQTHSTDGVHGSDAEARSVRLPHDSTVLDQQRSRPTASLVDTATWNFLHREFDDRWWQQRALGTRAADIRAPIIVFQAYQDEQTGPRGIGVWQAIPDEVPKRLVLTNGKHRTLEGLFEHGLRWLEAFLLDDAERAQSISVSDQRVWAYFETISSADGRTSHVNDPYISQDYPLPETVWSTFDLSSDGTMSPEGKLSSNREASVVSYRVRHDVDDRRLDRARFVLDFDEPTAICGPILLDLTATCTILDTDFYALLVDEDEQGRRSFLQRGLLRASHRAVDESQSEFVERDGHRLLVRPHHPHAEVQPVTPHQPTRYQIEIFPLGHVVRAGHRLVLEISQPPRGDRVNLDRGGNVSYAYDSAPPDADVGILCGGSHPSRLLLPLLPTLPPIGAETPKSDSVAGIYVEAAR